MKKGDEKINKSCRYVVSPLLLSTSVLLASDHAMVVNAAIVSNNSSFMLSADYGNSVKIFGASLGSLQLRIDGLGGSAGSNRTAFKAYANNTLLFGSGKITGTDKYIAKNFNASSTIGGSASLNGRSNILFSYKTGGGFNGSYKFDAGNAGYIGFKANGHYGWLHVSAVSPAEKRSCRGWAYDDSGNPIKAGQTEGGGSAVPEPSGLALLACGAAGVYALRRKRPSCECCK